MILVASFTVVVKAVIELDGKYLTLKRASHKKFMPLHWDFPGGKLEHGEVIEKALEREIFEETGLKARTEKILNVFSLTINGEAHVFIVFKAVPENFGVKVSAEHTEIRWVEPGFFKNEEKVEPFIKDLVEKNII